VPSVGVDWSLLARLSRIRRKHSRLGVREAGQEIGASAATVSRMERGKPVSADVLVSVCAWLGIMVEFVVEEESGA